MSGRSMKRFKMLPRRANEVWQGGLFRMPTWITEEDCKPFRPYIPLWVSKSENKVHVEQIVHPAERHDLSLVVDTLLAFACESQWGGYRPGAVEVTDRALGEHLSDVLADTGIEVRIIERLDAVQRVLDGLLEYQEGPGAQESSPSMMLGSGVTIPQLRQFADAAAAFYRAAPWQYLYDVDLVTICQPTPPQGMELLTVLGAARALRGIVFYPSVQVFTNFCRSCHESGPNDLGTDGLWRLTFNSILDLHGNDADVWEDHDLPLADTEAYPLLLRGREQPRYFVADTSELAFVTLVLNALANTTEAEIDSGHWSVNVVTQDGPCVVALEIPDLREPPSFRAWVERGFPADPRTMERQLISVERYFTEHSVQSVEEANQTLAEKQMEILSSSLSAKPGTIQEQAKVLCYQAFGAHGRRRVQLARAAIDLWPECPEAYTILAEMAASLHEQLALYKRSMQLARKELGAEVFRKAKGKFWTIVSTRTYMRARLGYALSLREDGQIDQYIQHLQGLLKLSKTDELEVRYPLLALLLQQQRDAEAASLLAMVDEESVVWVYARALLAFRLSDHPETARYAVHAAFLYNAELALLLLEEFHGPAPDTHSPELRQEAREHFEAIARAFQATPGALDWLDEEYRQWVEELHAQALATQRKQRSTRRKKAKRKKKKP